MFDSQRWRLLETAVVVSSRIGASKSTRRLVDMNANEKVTRKTRSVKDNQISMKCDIVRYIKASRYSKESN